MERAGEFEEHPWASRFWMFLDLFGYTPARICTGTQSQILPRAAMLKFLGVEEKTCDLLTGASCSKQEMVHIEHFKGKSVEELKQELKALSKKSGETLKKDERILVDGRMKVLKKLLKALKKSGKWEEWYVQTPRGWVDDLELIPCGGCARCAFGVAWFLAGLSCSLSEH